MHDQETVNITEENRARLTGLFDSYENETQRWFDEAMRQMDNALWWWKVATVAITVAVVLAMLLIAMIII